jgi:hypothetical protein
VRHIRSEARPKGKKFLLLTKLSCGAAPKELFESVKQSRLDIVPLDSLLTDAPSGCEAKTSYAHSSVTREDFCCSFCALAFGRGLVFVLALSTGADATDADGSAVATAGMSAGMLPIGQGDASLMRLAIVQSTSSGGFSLVGTRSKPRGITNVSSRKAGDVSTELSSEANAALDAPASRATAGKIAEAQIQARPIGCPF